MNIKKFKDLKLLKATLTELLNQSKPSVELKASEFMQISPICSIPKSQGDLSATNYFGYQYFHRLSREDI